MIRPPRRLVLVVVALIGVAVIAVLLLRQTALVLDAPQPHLIPEAVDTLPQMPLSIVEAPVTYDLDTAIGAGSRS